MQSAVTALHTEKKGRIMMKKKLFALCMAAMLLLAGCGGGNSMASGGAAADMSAPSAELDWNGQDSWEMEFPMESESQLSGDVYQNPRAKLIRRAELNIQTEQFDLA